MTRSIAVRTAENEDLAAIVNLIREFAEFEKLSAWCETTETDLRAAIFGANKFVNCLVAESRNEIVGYALFFPVFKSFRGERSMFLEDLYVSPQMRGRGLGLKMLGEIARIAKEQNCARLDWQTLKWNATAIGFYKNFGAKPDDENFDFSLRGDDFDKLAT